MGLGACSDSASKLDFQLKFGSDALRDETAQLTVTVTRGACGSNRAPEYRAVFGLDDTPPPVGELPKGTYCFHVAARNTKCQSFAKAEETRQLPSEGLMSLELRPDPALKAACTEAQCTAGRCPTDCPEGGADSDGDRVPDACDVCNGQDDLDPKHAGDADGDTVPNCNDKCPDADDRIDTDMDGIPDKCDSCVSEDIDTDKDGVPDGCDVCPGHDDMRNADAPVDEVPDGCDVCPGENDGLDTDKDTVPDCIDVCENGDDRLDADGDGIPDACDSCPNGHNDMDMDKDTVPDACDRCEGHDDNKDADMDNVPDGCDVCPGWNDSVNTDAPLDLVPDGCDVCAGGDDRLDADKDTVPDFCDKCAIGDDRLDTDRDGIPDACDACPMGTDKFGTAGSDMLTGAECDDNLVGGYGGDTLDGGDGNDRLTGDVQLFQADSLAGNILWLDGADISKVRLQSDRVTAWVDKSASMTLHDAFQAAASSRPTYKENGLGGRGVVSFNGLDQWLDLPPSVIARNAGTLVAVFQGEAGDVAFYGSNYNGNVAQQALYDGFGFPSSGGITIFEVTLGVHATSGFTYQNDRVLGQLAGSATSGSPIMLVGSYNLAERSMEPWAYSYLSGVEAQRISGDMIAGKPSSKSASTAMLGRPSKDDANYLSGSIAEVMAFSEVLSAAQLETVQAYLAGKWSMPLASGPQGPDVLTGGAGQDCFIWTNGAASGVGAGNRDRVTDFRGMGKDNDKLVFHGLPEQVTIISGVPFNGRGLPQLRWFEEGTCGGPGTCATVLQIDWGGDSVPDFEIELEGVASSELTGADFKFQLTNDDCPPSPPAMPTQ